MPSHHQSERKTKKAAKAGGKQLSKAALRSIVANEGTAEDFLEALEEGRAVPSFHLAKVERAVGGGRFMIDVDGESVPASLEGLFRGRGDFWKNPEVSTAVRAGGYVVAENVGLGHMARGATYRIVAILDAEQTARARALLLGKSSSNSNGLFNRSSEHRRQAAARAATVGAAARNLAAQRRYSRRSSGRSARSSARASAVSSEPNYAALNAADKVAAKEAKLTRRKERRRAKRAAGGGAWSFSWF